MEDADYVINPLTGRRIKTTGRVFKRLKRDGHVIEPPAAVDVAVPPAASIEQQQPHNEAYMATVDALDSWDDLDVSRKFQTQDGYMFDVLFLIQVVTTQLNQIKSNNPYPCHPFNPFTKALLTAADLQSLKNSIKANNLTTSKVLKAFLDCKDIWADDPNMASSTTWMNQCMNHFSKSKLRFVRNIEHIDMVFENIQDNGEFEGHIDVRLVGYWDDEMLETTNNECWALIHIEDPDEAMDFDTISIIDTSTIPFVLPEAYYYTNMTK